MLFNSYVFLVFAIVVFGAYYVLKHRAQNRMLLVASYVFYGAWDYRFLGLILIATVVDYTVGRLLVRQESPGKRKILLAVSCTCNLGILGFFKYAGFFVNSATQLLTSLGLDTGEIRLEFILPVGISFYTFQTMSYTIDVYRRRIEPVRNFFDFALYLAFFPQLVAGPIERATHLLPQLMNPRRVTRRHVSEGAWLITLGLFKKCVVADSLAVVVNTVFQSPDPGGGASCLLAVYAFAFQIYCDFSGYSCIARGLGKLMGIEIMVNFDRPYLATNPQEFWRRWHISLSTWLRDYLYIPLGGNRMSRGRTYVNLFVTMLLGGIWHGAAWGFVVWGALHGAVLIVYRAMARGDASSSPLWRRWASRLVMFNIVCLGWLVFRASDLSQVWMFLHRMAGGLTADPYTPVLLGRLLLFVVPLLVLEAWLGTCDHPRMRWGWRYGLGPVVCTGMWAAILMLSPPDLQEFIYFQF